MMKSFLIFTCLLSMRCFGQNNDYAIASIPSELKEGANVIVREDLTTFKIINQSKGSLRERFAITILNEKGNRYAKKTIHYNRLIRVKQFNAFVYDANGNQTKRLKNSDIYDHAAFDGVSMYSDNRVKEVNLIQSTYPYTVAFELELDFDYLYSIPGTYFQSGEKVSIQKVGYEITFPSNLKPRYKIIGIEDRVVSGKTKDGEEFMKWQYENLKPIKLEPFGPDAERLLPHIMIAPSKFEFEGYPGDMSSWEAYGKWQVLLNKDRDVLPQTTKDKVKQLINNSASTREKVKVLYQYLQSKTRYVGIQDGIGGLQPFEAKEVDNVGYGDCKGLSNYMIALLKEAGIKGYYTKILAGENEPEILLDFPSHQTNHIIVAVPLASDTVWLECTDQQNPFGYLGSFTGDRYAIMVTESGGKIVRTTKYPASKNLQIRTATLNLDVNGNGTAKVKTYYSGTQFENDNLNRIIDLHPDDQKKWIQENVHIPVFRVGAFEMKAQKDEHPSATVNVELQLDRYASVSGKRVFLTPNLMNRSTFIPEKIENRQQNVVWRSNYEDYDTVRIQIPESLYPEFVPQPIKVSSPFGEYSATFEFKNGEIIYCRTMKMVKGVHPKETYAGLIEFFKGVNKADAIKLVFLNKT